MTGRLEALRGLPGFTGKAPGGPSRWKTERSGEWEALRPELVRVRDALADLGPMLDGSAMSGSGSAYFGLCRNRGAAEEAARMLQPLGLGWVRVVTCGP